MFRHRGDRAEGKRVVVVDDEEDQCRIVELAIRSRDSSIQVLAAHDGEAGLKLIREQLPDIAILDIKMPKMNGYELLTRIRQDPQLKDMPVLMLTSLTADGSKTDAQWEQSLGVEGFLSKPYQIEDLLTKLQQLLTPSGES